MLCEQKAKQTAKTNTNSKSLPEFHHHKMIKWACHVDMKTDPKDAQYDRIVGMDLMNELGIDISFSTQKIVWAGTKLRTMTKCKRQEPEPYVSSSLSTTLATSIPSYPPSPLTQPNFHTLVFFPPESYSVLHSSEPLPN